MLPTLNNVQGKTMCNQARKLVPTGHAKCREATVKMLGNIA